MSGQREAIAREIPRLRRYARALTGTDSEADDLVQETLSRALARIEQWQTDDSPRKWLFAILHNLHVDSLRRHARRPQHLSLDAGEVSPSVLGDDPGTRRDLDQGLQNLSPEHRQVLLLVGLEGLTYAEAADVMGVPIGTIMSRLARARERLRILMACDLTEADVPPSSVTSLRSKK